MDSTQAWLTPEEARSVVHELKTPFNGVIGMASTLRSVPEMNHVQKAADRLLAYIDKAFDLSMMNQGSLLTPCTSLDLHTLLLEVSALVPGKLVLTSAPGLTLLGNEVSLAFVLYALGFAAAATPDRRLTAERIADQIVVSIGRSEISNVEQAVVSDILAFHGGSLGVSSGGSTREGGVLEGSWTATLPVRAQRPAEVHKGVFGFSASENSNTNLAHSLAVVALYLKYPFRCIQEVSAQALGTSDNKTQTKQLSLVQRCAVRVLAFAEEIEDAMLFAEAAPRRGAVYLQNVAAEVWESLAQSKDKRTQQPLKKEEVSMFNEVAGNLPEISGDLEKIKKALTHVVENALKFTVKGHVRIFSKVTRAAVALSIQDTGTTNFSGDFRRLFTPFVRLDAHKFLGLGLGLKVVYEVVRMHGGRIEVAENAGLTLTLWFPRDPIDPTIDLDVFDLSKEIQVSSETHKSQPQASSQPPLLSQPQAVQPLGGEVPAGIPALPEPAAPASVQAPVMPGAPAVPGGSSFQPQSRQPFFQTLPVALTLDAVSSHLAVEVELKDARITELEHQVERMRGELLAERWRRREAERRCDRLVGEVEIENVKNPKIHTLSDLLM